MVSDEQLTAAYAYLSGHPEGVRWCAQNSVAQLGTLRLAALDVTSYLGTSGPDWTAPEQRLAIFEQALWIFNRATADKVVFESVEGVGSRRYESPSTTSFMAERALRLLEPMVLREMGKISRG